VISSDGTRHFVALLCTLIILGTCKGRVGNIPRQTGTALTWSRSDHPKRRSSTSFVTIRCQHTYVARRLSCTPPCVLFDHLNSWTYLLTGLTMGSDFMQISHPVYSIYHLKRYPYMYSTFTHTIELNLPPQAPTN
jgi:hypothetical protein